MFEEFDPTWANFNQHVIAHECGHLLIAHCLGSDVEEVAVGPATGESSDLAGYIIHTREKLSPFGKLCVSIAGECAAARRDNRAPDFIPGSSDMEKASELVRSYYGCAVRDIVDTQYFRRGVTTVYGILERWSLALASLTLKLRRTYKLDSAQVTRTMENCGVVRELLS